ncbi:MAG: hypothetical protein Q9216_000653 [Gyalolechia sp. 2 TL-2023]
MASGKSTSKSGDDQPKIPLPIPGLLPPFRPGFLQEEKYLIAREILNERFATFGPTGSTDPRDVNERNVMEHFGFVMLALDVLKVCALEDLTDDGSTPHNALAKRLLDRYEWILALPSVINRRRYLRAGGVTYFDLAANSARKMCEDMERVEESIGIRTPQMWTKASLGSVRNAWVLISHCIESQPRPRKTFPADVKRALRFVDLRMEECER